MIVPQSNRVKIGNSELVGSGILSNSNFTFHLTETSKHRLQIDTHIPTGILISSFQAKNTYQLMKATIIRYIHNHLLVIYTTL